MRLVDEPVELDVLAAVMVRAGAFADIADTITPETFGSDRCRAIAAAIWAIARRRDSDLGLVSIERELERQGSRGLVGQVLHDLIRRRPGGHMKHARRLRDLAVARRLHELVLGIADETDDAEDHPLEWIDDVGRRITAAADVHRDLELVHISTLIADHQAVMASRENGIEQGALTGMERLDGMTGGLHAGDLTIIAARPSCGKSALALQFATHIAKSEPVAFFSAEMKRTPVMDRVVASAGPIDMQHLRRAQLDAMERLALVAAYDELRAGNAYVSDRRGWRVNEIVAQLRTWKRRHGRPRPDGTKPKCVAFVDYVQKIRASRSHHSREQEVSEISDTFATAAGELDMAIVLLAQLTRDAGKRPPEVPPQLEDLRECLAFDEWVYTPRGPVRIGSEPSTICAVGRSGPETRACDYIPKRYNRVFEVHSQFGRVRATARHLVLTGTGYKRVCDLVPGRDVIAAPLSIPCDDHGPMPHARLLGWMLGNGSLSGTPALIYRVELDQDVRREVEALGVTVRPRASQKSDNVIDAYLSNGVETGCIPNPMMTWIRSLGLEGMRAYDKSIPDSYLTSSTDTRSELLRGLWESDGTVTGGSAKYSTVSEVLARQIAWLLLTIGVRSSISQEQDGIFCVRASSCDAERMAPIVSGRPSDSSRFGSLAMPSDFRTDPSPAIFVELAAEISTTTRRLQKREDGSFKAISKSEMAKIVAETPGLESIAASPFMTTPGVGWGSLYAVTPIDGEVRVADLSVPGPNNFVANGVVVHNSGALEQDADNVLFVHRPDRVDLSIEPGAAALNIAKQRQGECGLIPLWFVGKHQRFEHRDRDYTRKGEGEAAPRRPRTRTPPERGRSGD